MIMQTIIARNHKGEEYTPLDRVYYEEIKRVNGDYYVIFHIPKTLNNNRVVGGIDKRWSITIWDDETKVETKFIVQNIYEKIENGMVFLEVDALHENYDKLKREVLNKVHNGSKTMEMWFAYMMEGSSFKLELKAKFKYAKTLESFGYDTRLNLLLRLCETFNVEFYILNNTIYVVDKIGDYKQDYVEYGVNLKTISRNRIMEGFGTRIKMFGQPIMNDKDEQIGVHQVQYTHPLAEEYGIIDLPPISDERFNDNNAMRERCKEEIEKSFNLSMAIEISDLKFSKEGISVYAGDFIRIADDRIGFDSVIRIVETRFTFNEFGEYLSREFLVGDYDEEYSQYLKDQNAANNTRYIIEGSKEDLKQVDEKLKEELKQQQQELEKQKENIDNVQLQAGLNGNIYKQSTEPKGTPERPLKDGDIWYRPTFTGLDTPLRVEMYIFGKYGTDTGVWRRHKVQESEDASNLSYGTINASRVNVIDINAYNISTGYLNADRLRAGSITADKITADAIQVGFNKIGNTVEVTGSGMNFYNGSELISRLTSGGTEFWRKGRKVGSIGPTYMKEKPDILGIQTLLETTGDYLSWSFRRTTGATPVVLMTLDPYGKIFNFPGIHLSETLHLSTLRPSNTPSHETGYLRLSSTVYGGFSYPSILSDNRRSGLLFGGNWLYMRHNGQTYDMDMYAKMNTILSGKTIAFPTGFLPDGRAKSWFEITFS